MYKMSIIILLKVIFRVLFVIVNNIYCIPTFCVWMFLFQPLRYYKPNLYWKIEGTFYHWLLAMVSMWSWSAGYDIVEMGDDLRLCLEDRTLIIANHQSTADVPMLMANFNAKKYVLPNIMWIMDRVFKFTNFGIVSIIHEDFFILSGKDAREEAVALLKDHLYKSYLPLHRKFMVLFPEGGFLRKRRETSRRYALKNNLPLLNNVSLPRMGAMHGIVEVMCPNPKAPSSERIPDQNQLRWVLDITIAYPDGKPLDLGTIVAGTRKPCQTFMFYRLYPSTELPVERDEVTKWLFTRWEEKERILEEFYKTGTMPVANYCPMSSAEGGPLPPQVVQQDPLRFLLLHLFFIASTYLHFRIASYAISFVW
ncbi:hypothetical protein O3M35_000464 [Rhynocoris fuscipes]|uniref:Phospholipid/glycerol acyltransferase domain-containing protein n=1 Tax=Rhynocoris fuscipes TaxID=488301 RepID=A0AAW1DLT5_9HEMI